MLAAPAVAPGAGATAQTPLSFLRGHQVAVGAVLIFALTWPIDVALVAQGRGLLPPLVPPAAGLMVGYGIVGASVLAAALTGGARGTRTLLRRYLIWRVDPRWYVVALLAIPALYLLALAIDALLGGARDFGAPYVLTVVGQPLSLWGVVPVWFLFELLTNGEEIGWRGYLLPPTTPRRCAYR